MVKMLQMWLQMENISKRSVDQGYTLFHQISLVLVSLRIQQ